ncbi:MAG: hypothetical protein ACO305_12900, partial [Rubrivivax sp.]
MTNTDTLPHPAVADAAASDLPSRPLASADDHAALPSSKKVYVRTFGCQMNEYDSDKMVDVLRAAEGYAPTAAPEQAAQILFNTCSVREEAQEQVF